MRDTSSSTLLTILLCELLVEYSVIHQLGTLGPIQAVRRLGAQMWQLWGDKVQASGG